VLQRQSLINPWGSSATPWPFAGDATCNRSLNMNTQPHQISYLGSWFSPLSPVSHSNSAWNPMIQIDTKLIAVGNAKVIDPATYTLADFEELIFHEYAPVKTCYTKKQWNLGR
jgi:hypothetical protein